MNSKSVSQFSVYQNLPKFGKQRDEAMQAMYFFSGLQNYLTVEDMNFGADPPDFVVKTANARIGIELTRSIPTTSSADGFPKIGEFKRWEKQREQNQITDQVTFLWGKYSLRESLDAFRSQLKNKAERAENYRDHYDETWLVFDTDEGSPAATFMVGQWISIGAKDETVQDFQGKFFYEMKRICCAAQPFDYVIFFHGPNLLAFPTGENRYGFPIPPAGLIERGSKAPDTFLDWKQNLKSSRGPVVTYEFPTHT